MSVDLRTELNDADNVTGWASDDAVVLDTTTGQRYEGTGSISCQLSNADEHTWAAQTSGGGGAFSLDLSNSTIYILVKDNLNNSFANGGVQITIGDGTNDIGYDVGGNDAVGLALPPFFQCYKLDVSVIVATPGSFATYAGSEASLAQTTITRVGYGSLHLAKAVGSTDNVWIDRIMYVANGSYALRINGGTSGTPETMADVQGDDVTNGWGMVGNPLGSQFQFFAPTEWGEPAANADAYFQATDEQWFWIGDNAGGHAIGANNFPFRVVGNATDTISWVVTRVTIVNTGTRVQFDISSANVNVLKIDSCVFTNLGAITFPAQSVGNKFCNDTVFNNCDQMDLSSCDMDGCIWNGTTDANGAIIWDENTSDVQNQDNLTFNSDGTGNAIEIAPTGAGPFTYSIDGYTFDGYAGQSGTDTNRVFFINPATTSADITINLSNSSALNVVGGGSGFSFRTVGGYTGTVTINQTVTLSVEVVDSDANPIPYAKVRIEQTGGTLVSDGFANNLGIFTDSTYNYGGDLDVIVVVRKNSPGATRYLETRQPSSISATGLTTTVSLQEDAIAGFLPMKGILQTGVVFEDINDASLSMTFVLPEGTSRKLLVGAMYWDSATNLTISSITYDGNAMTNEASASAFEQEGAGNFHEIQYYRYDVPDADTGEKVVTVTWSAAVNLKAIAFAVLDDVATGAADNAANNTGDQVTTNPSVTLNNSASAFSVVFLITDDTDSPSATGVATIRRSDQIAEPSPGFDGQMVAVLSADRTATGSHALGADYGTNSKTWVAGGATFLKN